MYKAFFKTLLDILGAFIILIILFPFLLIVVLVLYFTNQGSPFFIQLRTGKNGEIFKIIKFKTMNDKRSIDGYLLSDKNRITKIGALLRRTSMDEIPQMINVIRGDMSLIGPRPLLVPYLPLYSDFQYRRHEVKPGITGWAQVNGRNAVAWERKFELDVWYVDHLSLLLDIKIFLKTIQEILRNMIYSSDNIKIMEPFNGK
jgi:lipopolysaccharide/colanic/teichoic acid biosynthesis glycosyltransferase